MGLKDKIYLLTGILAATGVFYGPQANASLSSSFGTISSLSSYTITDTGSNSIFTDTWAFQVAGNALLNDSLSSTGITGSVIQGVELTSVELFQGATLIDKAILYTNITIIPVVNLLVTNYFANMSNITLVADQQYILGVCLTSPV